MKPRALIRVFNLLLSFDSEKGDKELEQEALMLIDEINDVLAEHLPKSLPQFQIEDLKKKIKIGVNPYKPSDTEDPE